MKSKAEDNNKFNNSSFVQGLVSCVTPVWNGEKWLSNLLDSLLAQTYPKVEIILSDDGSDDGTAAFAETYRKRFEEKGYTFKILRNEHCCAAAAVSAGLKEVTGEFIIWPDADDVLEPESIEKRVNAMNGFYMGKSESVSRNEKHADNSSAAEMPSAAGVSFAAEMPSAAGVSFAAEMPSAVRSLSYYFSGTTGERTNADEKRGDLKETHLFFSILESRTFVCCGCYMLRSKLLFEIYPERSIPVYNVGQNFQMLLPYMYRHECITIEDELYGVCVHGESHSRRVLTQKQVLKKYKDYEKLLDDIIGLADIKNRNDRKRIALWKLRRRSEIARKYNLFFMRAWAKFRRILLGEKYHNPKIK